jgi:cysteine synthase
LPAVFNPNLPHDMKLFLTNTHRYGCTIVMPDDMSREKSDLLEKFGATIIRVQ